MWDPFQSDASAGEACCRLAALGGLAQPQSANLAGYDGLKKEYPVLCLSYSRHVCEKACRTERSAFP